MVNYNEVKNRSCDYLEKKVHIRPLDIVVQAVTTSAANSIAPLVANWSVGSPTLVNIPGTRTSGFQMNGSTFTLDYHWRVPYDVDIQQPIYVRPFWTVDTIGTTQTCTWLVNYSTITAAGVTLASSPTTALDVAVGASSYPSATVKYALTAANRGKIGPLGTGISANMTMADNVEYIHFAMQPSTTSNITFGSTKVYFMGLDIEYTPRWFWGGASGKEGRKTETNTGWAQTGATTQY